MALTLFFLTLAGSLQLLPSCHCAEKSFPLGGTLLRSSVQFLLGKLFALGLDTRRFLQRSASEHIWGSSVYRTATT